MRRLKDYITALHKSTKREYLERMNDDKVSCMIEAKKYEFNYWDGDRRYGYGGYKYIQGRWSSLAKQIITDYNLKDNSRILDAGCGKGFLLLEIKKQLPSINIVGIDISKHALKEAPEIFKNMVTTQYQAVYRPKKIDFGDVKLVRGSPSLNVFLVDPDGNFVTATYLMQRQPNNGWLIAGCYLNTSNFDKT